MIILRQDIDIGLHMSVLCPSRKAIKAIAMEANYMCTLYCMYWIKPLSPTNLCHARSWKPHSGQMLPLQKSFGKIAWINI